MSTLRIIDKSNFPNKPVHIPTAAEKLALRQAVAVACGESGDVDYEQWCPVDPVTGDCAGGAESGPPLRSGNACYDRNTIHTIMTGRGNPGFNKDPLTRRTYGNDERAMLGLGPPPVLTHIDVLSQQGLLNEEPSGTSAGHILFNKMVELNNDAYDPGNYEYCASDEAMLALVHANYANGDDSVHRIDTEWAKDFRESSFSYGAEWEHTALEVAMNSEQYETAAFLVENGAFITKEALVLAWISQNDDYAAYRPDTYRYLFFRMLDKCKLDPLTYSMSKVKSIQREQGQRVREGQRRVSKRFHRASGSTRRQRAFGSGRVRSGAHERH